MSSPWIEGLRSVALNVPDLAKAEDFYTRVWNLDVAERQDDALFLRGTGSDHHLLALKQFEGIQILRLADFLGLFPSDH